MFPHLRAVDVADALAQLQLELARCWKPFSKSLGMAACVSGHPTATWKDWFEAQRSASAGTPARALWSSWPLDRPSLVGRDPVLQIIHEAVELGVRDRAVHSPRSAVASATGGCTFCSHEKAVT